MQNTQRIQSQVRGATNRKLGEMQEFFTGEKRDTQPKYKKNAGFCGAHW